MRCLVQYIVFLMTLLTYGCEGSSPPLQFTEIVPRSLRFDGCAEWAETAILQVEGRFYVAGADEIFVYDGSAQPVRIERPTYLPSAYRVFRLIRSRVGSHSHWWSNTVL